MSSVLSNAAVGNVDTLRQGQPSLNRTCQGCKKRKIKCIPSPEKQSTGDHKCSRCSKLSLDCEFLPPAVKRTRRRNETRIKELEQKLQEIQDAVVQRRLVDDVTSSELSRADVDISSWQAESETRKSSSTPASAPNEPSPSDRHLNESHRDPVARGIISVHYAQELYWNFCSSLASIYPFVLPPAGSSWQDVRTERPALFRALLTASASSVDPILFETLFDDTVKYLAEEVVLKGQKSLDLVQALLLTTTWYCPPKKFQDLKFGQFAHMAATMVIDLRSINDDSCKIPHKGPPSAQLRETCRTYVATYFLCSSISLSQRRQTVLRYGPWVEHCMEALQSPQDTHPNDIRLVEWTKLQIIAEDGLAAVGVGQDLTVDFADPRTRLVLKGSVDQTTRWRQRIAEDIVNESMEMHYHMIRISLHESVLYGGHNLEDFRPPYKLRAFPLTKKSYTDSPSEISNALTQCALSAQSIVRLFLSLSTQTLRSVPIIVYTRLSYAVVVLVKFDLSARVPQTEMDLLHRDIDAKAILFQLIEKLDPATGSERFQVPGTFLGVLSRVAKWYIAHVEHVSLDFQDGIIEPMMHLGIGDVNGASSIQHPSPNPGSKHVTTSGDVGCEQEQGLQFLNPAATDDWDDAAFVRDGWLGMMANDPMMEFSRGFLDFDWQ